MNKLTVVTPVGPGHEKYAEEAKISVQSAARYSDYFDSVDHIIVDDTAGELGRSKARNKGILEADSDWIFLLDADDLMIKDALCWFEPPKDPSTVAIFGSVYIQYPASKWMIGAYIQNGHRVIDAIIPQYDLKNGWDDLVNSDIVGTISMGAFFKRSALIDNLFLESLNSGEDFEFYLNLFSKHNFVKERRPLVLARTRVPSAVGPKGYQNLEWCSACRPYVDFWKSRGRQPLTFEERQHLFDRDLSVRSSV